MLDNNWNLINDLWPQLLAHAHRPTALYNGSTTLHKAVHLLVDVNLDWYKTIENLIITEAFTRTLDDVTNETFFGETVSVDQEFSWSEETVLGFSQLSRKGTCSGRARLLFDTTAALQWPGFEQEEMLVFWLSSSSSSNQPQDAYDVDNQQLL